MRLKGELVAAAPSPLIPTLRARAKSRELRQTTQLLEAGEMIWRVPETRQTWQIDAAELTTAQLPGLGSMISSRILRRGEELVQLDPSMKRITMRKLIILGAVTLLGVFIGVAAQSNKSQGITYRAPSGTTLRLLLDESNVGPEVTVGEINFPPNMDSGDHQHSTLEMFYVVSGELEHVVNGKSEMLKPGMAGYVKPPDTVRHKTGTAGAKAVVIWVPGDEAKKITARWSKEP
jgi:quercetin dioxygenase-like cupin family protein